MVDPELRHLVKHVSESEDRWLSTLDPSERARRELAEYVAQPRVRRGASRHGLRPWHELQRYWRPSSLVLSLAAALVLGLWVSRAVWPPPLTFSVGSAARAGVLRAWESAPQGGMLPLRFSDGTVVSLESDARARVVAVGRGGAEVVIESGHAKVSVVPVRTRGLAESAWRFSTGPFSIEVKGTRFDVGWDPRAGEFTLDLFEGSVIVKGCGRDEGHVIGAGQGVRAACARGEWSIVSLASQASRGGGQEQRRATSDQFVAEPGLPESASQSDKSAANSEPPSGSPDAGQRTPPQKKGRAASSEGSWRELGRSAHFSEAYRRALGAGFDAECERVSAPDLMMLGDAARLNDDAERARQAYSALRRRFPDTDLAAQAAFVLGRLSVDGDASAAAAWFETYLRERPRGALAQAAADRLLELAAKLGDVARQQQVAKEYLERYPSGPHAQDAVKLLGRTAKER